jgi:hypothetical protein
MSFELRGKVAKIFDVQEFSSGFTKREFVITTEEQYPQDIKFELIKDKSKLIDSYNVGDPVVVKFDIRGSEWKERYYVNLNAWRIDPAGQAAAEGAPAQGGTPPTPPPPSDPGPDVDLGDADGDDLPF